MTEEEFLKALADAGFVPTQVASKLMQQSINDDGSMRVMLTKPSELSYQDRKWYFESYVKKILGIDWPANHGVH